MNTRYNNCIFKWNDIFRNEDIVIPKKTETGNNVFDAALDWLCKDVHNVLDFGCGNGTMLFYSAVRGTKNHHGIDLSEEGIKVANKRKQLMEMGQYNFIEGGIEAMKTIKDNTFDAIILSNIVDNLYPDDAVLLMKEVARVLKIKGKVLIKLNPYITESQIKEWDIKIIDGNLLDDGLILWNQTTDEWNVFLGNYLELHSRTDIYYPEHEQYNRLFLMTSNYKKSE
jgi:SAM-dependent methyltransferase